jgi:hypothetical protein
MPGGDKDRSSGADERGVSLARTDSDYLVLT